MFWLNVQNAILKGKKSTHSMINSVIIEGDTLKC